MLVANFSVLLVLQEDKLPLEVVDSVEQPLDFAIIVVLLLGLLYHLLLNFLVLRINDLLKLEDFSVERLNLIFMGQLDICGFIVMHVL